MQIRLMTRDDFSFVRSIDPHANEKTLERRLFLESCYILIEGNDPVGLFHYTLLWDSLPFLNLLYLLPPHRKKGLGREAMAFWENEMQSLGYETVLISTQVDEEAQHFYRKIGYTDCGALVFPDPRRDQPMEMFMRKVLK